MDWDKLRIFHAVARAGSLTHAGDTLHLSQSAVSRQISALETQLGVTLFHRHARGLDLTEQGEILFQATSELDDRISATRDRLTDSREKPRGPLRITTTAAFGSTWLTPRLKTFMTIYPDIQVQLLLNDSELDLSAREADVAIRLHPPAQADLIQRRLFRVHYHLYAAPDYVARRGQPQTLDDLDDHDIILYGADVPKPISHVNWLASVGREGAAPRRAACHINSMLGMLNAVEAGMGLASLPDYLCHDKPHLVRLMPGIDVPHFDTYFVYPEELRNSKRVAVFRDFICSETRNWTF